MTDPHPAASSLPVAPPLPVEPPAPPLRGTNGFAIAALVLGFCGGLLSVIFGIIALVQIRRTGQAGKGLAITGLVASGVWLAVLVGGFVWAINSGAERGSSGEITEGGSVSLEDVRPGDCVSEVPEVAVLSVPAVPCAEQHDGEVYAVFDVTASGDWPGEEAVIAEAEACVDLLARDYPAAYADEQVQIVYFTPNEASWEEGDRAVICLAHFPDGPRTGPLPG